MADPMRVVPAHLPARPRGRVVVVGAGKASARMAEAVEATWGSCEGLVVTRYGYGRPTRGIEIVEAAHPVPDEAGLSATRRMLALLSPLDEATFVLALLSGGASALLVHPAAGVTLADKRAINAMLLASGAPIQDMNVVRKHLSGVKGGRLAAAAWPARVLALVISDVTGDDLAVIGSGPTVGEVSTPADARAVIERWRLDVPASVREALDRPGDAVPPSDPRLARTETRLVAAPMQSLLAAARLHARLALDRQVLLRPGDRPLVLLSGGELTVTRRGDGVGGPNAEYALALALALDGATGIQALACDTDGVDGAAEVAGAVVGPDTLARAASRGLNPEDRLAHNDAHTFFARLGDQVITGPTLTNVNDFRAILVAPT